jgi:hypothetical protein
LAAKLRIILKTEVRGLRAEIEDGGLRMEVGSIDNG